MRKAFEFVIILLASPISVLLIRHFIFHLEPLSHWKFPAFGLGLLFVEGGVFFTFLWPKKNVSKSRKAKIFGVALALTALMIYLYELLIEKPPTQPWLAWYNAAAYITYFMSYLAYGYASTFVFDYIVRELFRHFFKK